MWPSVPFFGFFEHWQCHVLRYRNATTEWCGYHDPTQFLHYWCHFTRERGYYVQLIERKDTLNGKEANTAIRGDEWPPKQGEKHVENFDAIATKSAWFAAQNACCSSISETLSVRTRYYLWYPFLLSGRKACSIYGAAVNQITCVVKIYMVNNLASLSNWTYVQGYAGIE